MLSRFSTLAVAGLFTSHVLAQVPAEPKGVKTITSPGGVQIRYKEPTFCETTPGVNAYSGYIDLDKDTHYYFLFYESRHSPKDDPVTLWLTGGPGSDSLLAAYVEHGPCFVTTSDLKPAYNDYSWNNVSNVLYLSQPMGTGWSYSKEAPGTLDDFGTYQPPNVNGIDGQYPVFDPTVDDTTQKAAVSAWHVIQGFFNTLPHLSPDVNSKSFNLWTESYGGHYGPIFYDYFYNQSQEIRDGKAKGIELNFESLGVGNGIFDYKVQAPYYLKYSVDNNYGIVGYNETIYNYGEFALNNPGGCLASIDFCRTTKGVSLIDKAVCSEAAVLCQDTVEALYYIYSDRGAYDIRANASAQVPPTDPVSTFLNQPKIQDDSAVSLNWTTSNNEVYYAFQQSGDMVFPSSIGNIAHLLDKGVRVTLYAGDADYACNWYGGEAVSLAVNYSQTANFHAAGYAPFLLDGKEYGAVRQYGNFSFLRVYESGHQVPYFQPAASLAFFSRTLAGLDIATGLVPVTGTYATKGNATSTIPGPLAGRHVHSAAEGLEKAADLVQVHDRALRSTQARPASVWPWPRTPAPATGAQPPSIEQTGPYRRHHHLLVFPVNVGVGAKAVEPVQPLTLDLVRPRRRKQEIPLVPAVARHPVHVDGAADHEARELAKVGHRACLLK
ncbi:Serine carboxypeptidase B [Cladobotryum mycophilum]|uniref:Carboxypeptidase n=1 Tax=Cladobotryum mycophilum TaxID=491253 RepID=A0ABR0T3V3_9HYPO